MMINRKWSLIFALLVLLIPGVALAQTGRPMLSPANPRPVRIGVIAVLPRNETEFEAIHSRNPRFPEYVDMNRIQRRLELMNQPGMRSYPEARTSVGFKEYVRQASEQTILVVGHNDNGKFRFADGTSLALTEMGSLLQEQDKQAIMLSCEANKYVPQFAGPARRISTRDAIRMLESIGKSTERLPTSFGESFSLDTGSIQAEIYRIERFSRIESVAKPIAIVGALTSAGGTALIIEQRRSNRKR